jgi:hypothetical protein
MTIGKKVLITVGAIVGVLVIGFAILIIPHMGLGADINNPPKFIQADFIDLNQIYAISKFRSGAGHDFSGNGETCRSMKHYYTPQYDPTIDARSTKDPATGRTIPPQPNGTDDVDIMSPVDGTIADIHEEQLPVGKQIYIIPDGYPAYQIRLFHVYPVDGLKKGSIGGLGGSHVKAGEKIGVIAKGQSTDVAVQVGFVKQNFVSYFDVMPDNIFASYIARGATSRNDFIISKAERDANPLECSGEEFVRPAGYDETQDDVHLSGYVTPVYNQGNMNSGGNQSQQNGNNQYGNYPTGGTDNNSSYNNSGTNSY